MQRLLEISRNAAASHSLEAVQSELARLDAEGSRKSFHDRLRYPEHYSIFTLSKAISKSARAETERSIILCALAVKRYQLRHSRLPESLGELTPDIFPEVPDDFMDGKPVKYHPNADGSFTIYSVGENGMDDGGDTSLLPDKTGHRNPWDRKDFVWPQPATPEEVEVWRKEQAKN